MNTAIPDRIKQIALEYAKRETKFSRSAVTAVEEIGDYDDTHGRCFVVKMSLSHSPEDIEEIIAKGDPNEAEVTREFLEGEFNLRLVVAGETVIASEWENMDVT
ncbi:MAG: hypothetical protein GYA36_20370 [Veillonellaceae bacterium]|nr:hypothetical protein [Veillonellaceae bacterium]